MCKVNEKKDVDKPPARKPIVGLGKKGKAILYN